MNRYLAGAMGGLLATVPMTLVMTALFRRLPRDDQYPLPPREITDEVLRRTGRSRALSEYQHRRLSLTAHFGYGALTGALYPLLLSPALLYRPRRQLLIGSVYGVAIWAGSYLGWIPALKILAPGSIQPAPRLRLMIFAHLVWGAGTVLIGEGLANADTQRLKDRHDTATLTLSGSER